MDPQSASFTPRDDILRVHADMMRLQQTQAEHSERIMRLERRNDDDARVKSVWGASSPFPSVLGGTPQHGPVQHPPADAFPGFDDQQNNLIGSLQLDADDEPRRIGATSRANSVRFDETANQGHWSHASRSSVDLIPRTGSSLGGHPMMERTYSHKSDGRQSSAGHSVHSVASGRANSLALDTAFGSSHSQTSPVEPPSVSPGLYLLGPVPSIIRCWLNTKFKHESLLYAAVCTASCKSRLDIRLVEQLGFMDQIVEDDGGERKIKLAMYLPEATTRPSSFRSSIPTPQLPSLIVDFTVVDGKRAGTDPKAIQIFLGSDMLRAHNADILFSSNTLTLFDEYSTKLSIPLVRPEDERVFKSLTVTSISASTNNGLTHQSYTHQDLHSLNGAHRASSSASASSSSAEAELQSATIPGLRQSYVANAEEAEHSGNERPSSSLKEDLPSSHARPTLSALNTAGSSRESIDASSAKSATSKAGSSSAIWSNWRRDAEKDGQGEPSGGGKAGISTYQRRDQGIKVLRPSRSISRTMSGTSGGSPSPATSQSRFFDDGKRKVGGEGQETLEKQSGSAGPTAAAVSKENQAPASKPRFANPVGGASAFSWLNSSGSSK